MLALYGTETVLYIKMSRSFWPRQRYQRCRSIPRQVCTSKVQPVLVLGVTVIIVLCEASGRVHHAGTRSQLLRRFVFLFSSWSFSFFECSPGYQPMVTLHLGPLPNLALFAFAIDSASSGLHLWLLYKWRLSWSRRLKSLLQMGQECSPLSLCVRRCLERFDDSPNDLPHMSHLRGLYPVCVRSCMASRMSED